MPSRCAIGPLPAIGPPYAEIMDPLPLALLALATGVLIGGIVAAVIMLALRARERARV